MNGPTTLYGGQKSEVSDRRQPKRGPSYTRVRVSLCLFIPHAFAFLHSMPALRSSGLILSSRQTRVCRPLSSLILLSSPVWAPLRCGDESAYVAAGTFLRTTLRSRRVRDAFAPHRVPKHPHSDAFVLGISIRFRHESARDRIGELGRHKREKLLLRSARQNHPKNLYPGFSII